MVLAYPFKIAPNGMSVATNNIRCQLDMLLNSVPGSRLFQPDYGVDLMAIEQEFLSDVSPERTLFIVNLQEQCARYIPELLLTDVVCVKGDTDVQLKVSISYTSRVTGQKGEVIWRPDSSLT